MDQAESIKRTHSEGRSLGSRLQCEKKAGIFPSPVITLPEETPSWAKCLHDSLCKQMSNLVISANESVNFVMEEAQKARVKGEQNEIKINKLQD